MYKIAIPVICLLAHVQLVLVLFPGMWREIDVRGLRWHNIFVLFFVPLGLSALIGSWLAAGYATMPTWVVVAGALAVDAFLVSAVISAIALGSRRQTA